MPRGVRPTQDDSVLPSNRHDLRVTIIEKLHPRPRLWHMREGDEELRRMADEPNSDNRNITPLYASGAKLKDALYLRAILDAESKADLSAVKAMLLRFDFISDSTWTEAKRSLGLVEIESRLTRDTGAHGDVAFNHLTDLFAMLDLDRERSPWIRRGHYSHFHAAATSYNTLMETDRDSRLSATHSRERSQPSAERRESSNTIVIVRDRPGNRNASQSYLYQDRVLTAWEERVTSFVIDFVSGLASLQSGTRRLDCVMKPDRNSFHFGQSSCACGSKIDAVVQRESSDPNLVPPYSVTSGTVTAKRAVYEAWRMLLTAEFKGNPPKSGTSTKANKTMIQVAFHMAGRIYDMYRLASPNDLSFQEERAVLGLLVVGCEFVPVLAIYTSKWLRYAFNPNSLVMEESVEDEDCLRLVRLGAYDVHKGAHEKHAYVLSTLMLAVLSKAYGERNEGSETDRSSPPQSQIKLQERWSTQLEIRGSRVKTSSSTGSSTQGSSRSGGGEHTAAGGSSSSRGEKNSGQSHHHRSSRDKKKKSGRVEDNASQR